MSSIPSGTLNHIISDYAQRRIKRLDEAQLKRYAYELLAFKMSTMTDDAMLLEVSEDTPDILESYGISPKTLTYKGELENVKYDDVLEFYHQHNDAS